MDGQTYFCRFNAFRTLKTCWEVKFENYTVLFQLVLILESVLRTFQEINYMIQ
ncbi:hypothetical protein LEP1GSC125_4042 [Leptospira mayottensis 200901122]|uniref:Uncharacterized protein n=1 Tax=Leptospira mayottensis 200901122 TaxID=1193010 RepID=A0AA87MR03_9LEPT|nr:hypothetical protein LEP1GSC125_4042 [Leptospira mayottensis 200901122]